MYQSTYQITFIVWFVLPLVNTCSLMVFPPCRGVNTLSSNVNRQAVQLLPLYCPTGSGWSLILQVILDHTTMSLMFFVLLKPKYRGTLHLEMLSNTCQCLMILSLMEFDRGVYWKAHAILLSSVT